jgi:hypothetical protein
MSIKFNQNAVSSMSSIISSIENDRYVYHWFLILISLPEIQQKICVQNKKKEEYQSLKKIQIAKIIIYVALALTITAFCLTKQFWILLLGILPLVILVNLFRKNRRRVAAISEQFLLENIQPDELNRQTLYQTCEHLSKKYNIPSLVDIITCQDFIGRKVLLGAILILIFLFPINDWKILIVVFVVLSATVAILNTSIILRKLK